MNFLGKLNQFMFEWKVKKESRSSAYMQLELGDMYFQGRSGIKGFSPTRYYDLQDHGKAFKWYMMAAENGVIEAQSIIADIYRHNADAYSDSELADVVRHRRGQNLRKAFEWYTKAAEQGDLSAQYALANMYLKGENRYIKGEVVEGNFDRALYWYTKAAEAGYPDAQSAMGDIYCKGNGVQKDFKKALDWYAKARDVKNIYSVYFSGNLDFNAATNKEKFEWALNAGNLGCAEAQYDVGIKLRDGYGVKQDFSEAVYWFEKSAKQGHYDSQLALGAMYYCGEGIAQDELKAAEWIEEAAKHAFKDWKKVPFPVDIPLTIIGDMFLRGDGVGQDFKKASEWYSETRKHEEFGKWVSSDAATVLKLIKRNDTSHCYGGRLEYLLGLSKKGDINACFSLGMIYFGGVCQAKDFKNCSSRDASCSEFETVCATGKDLKKSFEYTSKAAKQGHLCAQFALGYMYQQGKGVPQNSKEAVQWYEKAATQGYLPAQGVLGDIHYLGLLGFPQDHNKAFVWYSKATEQGDLAAQSYLADMCADGIGVNQDFEKSMEWSEKVLSHFVRTKPLMGMYYPFIGLRQNLIEAYKSFILASVFTDPLVLPADNVPPGCPKD